MREQLKWYDEKADNSPWLDALAELRQRAAREGIASSTFRRSPLRSTSMQRRHWATETTTITQAQPITISVVYIRGTGNTDLVFNGLEVVAQSGNFRLIAGGSPADATAADGSWHAAQGVFNGASSAGYVDGSATTGLNPGTGGASSNTICLGCVIVAGSFDGFIAETGLWPSAFNATQAGNLNTNQHGSNGYNF